MTMMRGPGVRNRSANLTSERIMDDQNSAGFTTELLLEIQKTPIKIMKWTCVKKEICKKRCTPSHPAIYLLFTSLFVMPVGIQACFAQGGKGVLEIPAKGVYFICRSVRIKRVWGHYPQRWKRG